MQKKSTRKRIRIRKDLLDVKRKTFKEQLKKIFFLECWSIRGTKKDDNPLVLKYVLKAIHQTQITTLLPSSNRGVPLRTTESGTILIYT